MGAVLHQIGAFIMAHEAAFGLLLLAFIGTMRDELPPPFNRLPWLVWLYAWLHDGLKAFVSFRSPNAQTQQDRNKQQGKTEPQ
jgi:hypothetical protein